MKIYIDAGHGGPDPGAQVLDGWTLSHLRPAELRPTVLGPQYEQRMISESSINQLHANHLAHRLAMFHDVRQHVFAPLAPKFTLKERVDSANEWPADLFVSVHANKSDDPTSGAHGFEVWTSPGQTKSDTFAEFIYRALADDLELHGRPDMSDGDMDREDKFYVLRHTTMPAVLIEYGFMDDVRDIQDLQSPALSLLMARSIMTGIERAAVALGWIDELHS